MLIKSIRLAFSSLLALALSGCGDPPAPEEIVAERAQARWDAMVARDFEKAWEYYSPGFRAQTSQSVFAVDLQRGPVKWEKVRLLSVECADQRCETLFQVDYSAPGAPGVQAGMEVSRQVSGVWIEIEGNWWYSAG